MLQRLLDDERDLLAGFGRWDDEAAEQVREARERSKAESKERLERLRE